MKYLKYSSLPILLLASFFNIWIDIPGFSATTTLFFGIGAYCAIHHISLIKISKMLFIPSLIFSLICVLLLFYNFIPLLVFNIVGLPMFIYLFYLLTHNNGSCPKVLSGSSMFIYVAHGYIVESPNVWGIVNRILPSNIIGNLVGYLLVPAFAITILVLLNFVLRKFVPHTMSIICGR